MAKASAVERDLKRRRLAKKYAGKRAKLKAVIKSKDVSMEERFQAVLELSELPKNSAKERIRNRCALTGRPRANYRKFNLCRVALRDLASKGELPGVTKSSW
ncbi:MAG TPA: 30S ribosomal protein S14 [Micavibrio sp.]|nr:30S ribosomal protein S14 [Micavibrio sp.]HIL27683.1 30S ribosomal protein S14 [Micavibrio sp.]